MRGAARLGAWWGTGHAAALLALGIPLIMLKSSLPAWLETGAETAVGVVILALALRIVVKWVRGDYRSGLHHHMPRADPATAISTGAPGPSIPIAAPAPLGRRWGSACSTDSRAPGPSSSC